MIALVERLPARLGHEHPAQLARQVATHATADASGDAQEPTEARGHDPRIAAPRGQRDEQPEQEVESDRNGQKDDQPKGHKGSWL